MSSLIITGKNSTISNSTFTLRLPRAINFQNKEIALVNCQWYYSNPNIHTQYNNNTFSVNYIKNGTNHTLNVSLPNGYYSYADLNNFLHQRFDSNGIFWLDADGGKVYPIEIVENPVYYSCTVSFIVFGSSLPAGFTDPNNLDFSTATVLNFGEAFGKIIGFTPSFLPKTLITASQSFNSDFTPNISPVDAWVVNTNLVNEITYDTNYSNTVYILNQGDTKYGSLVYERPPVLSYFPIADGIYSSIVISIKDQDNVASIPFLDYSGTIFKFSIRDKR
jgi:hypothetical protein